MIGFGIQCASRPAGRYKKEKKNLGLDMCKQNLLPFLVLFIGVNFYGQIFFFLYLAFGLCQL